jgi:hypothetical protein
MMRRINGLDPGEPHPRATSGAFAGSYTRHGWDILIYYEIYSIGGAGLNSVLVVLGNPNGNRSFR